MARLVERNGSGYSPLVLEPLGIFTRLWWSLICALRVLVDGAFAARTYAVREAMPEPAETVPALRLADQEPEPDADKERASEPEPERQPPAPAGDHSALVLLSLLQREGRLVDFLEQDIADFDDEDVGAAARVVHDGCHKALHAHAKVAPIRSEDEDSRVEIAAGYPPSEVKLSGDVGPKPPYRGVLRHRGWRVSELSLPEPLAGHDVEVVAPAEVEL